MQSLHFGKSAKVRDVPRELAPARKSLGLEDGPETVAWLYHFEDDGSELKDEERAYTVAVSLKKREPGLHGFPSDSASVVFFCDNWGGGFRAAEARATQGWLDVREAGERDLKGRFDVKLEGYKERPDQTREGVTIYLRGRFHARR